jgi:hypothetical protein
MIFGEAFLREVLQALLILILALAARGLDQDILRARGPLPLRGWH